MKPQDHPESEAPESSSSPLPYESYIRIRQVDTYFGPRPNFVWQVYLYVNHRSLEVGPMWGTEKGAQEFGKLVARVLKEMESMELSSLRNQLSLVETNNAYLAAQLSRVETNNAYLAAERDAMALSRDVAHHNRDVARGRVERLENDNALLATEREELRKLKFDLEKDVRRLTKERDELNASLFVVRHNPDAIRIDSGRQLAEMTSRLEELKLRTEECWRLRERLRKVAEYLTRGSRL